MAVFFANRERDRAILLQNTGFRFCDDYESKLHEDEAWCHQQRRWDAQALRCCRPLIAGSYEASSTDHPDQNIGLTTFDDDGFWSSIATDPDVDEHLIYTLHSSACQVHFVKLAFYRAVYQIGHPVYPSESVSFFVGPSPTQLYAASPVYEVDASGSMQVFPLYHSAPRGGYLAVRFNGKRQKQREDDMHYIAVRYVCAVGDMVPYLNYGTFRQLLRNQGLSWNASWSATAISLAMKLRQQSVKPLVTQLKAQQGNESPSSSYEDGGAAQEAGGNVPDTQDRASWPNESSLLSCGYPEGLSSFYYDQSRLGALGSEESQRDKPTSRPYGSRCHCPVPQSLEASGSLVQCQGRAWNGAADRRGHLGGWDQEEEGDFSHFADTRVGDTSAEEAERAWLTGDARFESLSEAALAASRTLAAPAGERGLTEAGGGLDWEEMMRRAGTAADFLVGFFSRTPDARIGGDSEDEDEHRMPGASHAAEVSDRARPSAAPLGHQGAEETEMLVTDPDRNHEADHSGNVGLDDVRHEGFETGLGGRLGPAVREGEDSRSPLEKLRHGEGGKPSAEASTPRSPIGPGALFSLGSCSDWTITD